MSDSSQGPGWWLASDGRWYPPSDAPSPGWWQASDGRWYPPSAQRPPAAPSGPAWPWWTLVGAAAATILGSVLPWGRVSTPFATLSVSGTDGGRDGWITLFLGLILLALALIGRVRGSGRAYAIGAMVAGAIVVLVAIIDIADISRAAGEGDVGGLVTVSVGVGLILTLFAGAIGVGAATMALVLKPASAPAYAGPSTPSSPMPTGPPEATAPTQAPVPPPTPSTPPTLPFQPPTLPLRPPTIPDATTSPPPPVPPNDRTYGPPS